MPIIDLGKGMLEAEKSEFWAARGKAIQSYANLEQALCRIFSQVSSISFDIAAIIFFKIASADARNKIIDKLFKKSFGNRFNLFRNSLIDQLGPINIERNEIVHWNAINLVEVNEEGETIAKVQLRPPTAWDFRPNAPYKSTNDFINFGHKCDFYFRVCNMFHVITTNSHVNIPEETRRTWLDIFEQPIVYPPPEDHLLYQKQPTPASPSESYQG